MNNPIGPLNQPLGSPPTNSLAAPDMVNEPPHYKAHASGVQCIEIAEQMSFCLGNAVKYIWRADEKGKAIQDLKKARWYIEREIARRLTLEK